MSTLMEYPDMVEYTMDEFIYMWRDEELYAQSPKFLAAAHNAVIVHGEGDNARLHNLPVHNFPLYYVTEARTGRVKTPSGVTAYLLNSDDAEMTYEYLARNVRNMEDAAMYAITTDGRYQEENAVIVTLWLRAEGDYPEDYDDDKEGERF